MPASVAAGVLAVALAVVHASARRFRSQGVVPRRWWLSVGSGVSVAYVFVHLLPEIAERQARVVEATNPTVGLPLATREHLVFLGVLGGFAAFYGLEQLVRRSGAASDRSSDGTDSTGNGGDRSVPSRWIFRLHVGAFVLYNALIGYLLVHREVPGTRTLVLYATAMALHFVVTDHGMREHHATAYDDLGRWLLAGAVVVGFVVGIAVSVPALALDLLFAGLAGAIVLNVIKEELPAERESSFVAFAAGLVGYTVVLLAL